MKKSLPKLKRLQDEVSDLKKELANLRAQSGAFNLQPATCQRSNRERCKCACLGNPRFKRGYPANAGRQVPREISQSGSGCPGNGINCHRGGDRRPRQEAGLKAGDLITGIGGKGGGRPNLAQGSLPAGGNVKDALDKVAKAVEEKLK